MILVTDIVADPVDPVPASPCANNDNGEDFMRESLERFELDRKLQPEVLQDHELDVVVGGSMLSAAFNNVIKSIGDGLSTMARKG